MQAKLDGHKVRCVHAGCARCSMIPDGCPLHANLQIALLCSAGASHLPESARWLLLHTWQPEVLKVGGQSNYTQPRQTCHSLAVVGSGGGPMFLPNM